MIKLTRTALSVLAASYFATLSFTAHAKTWQYQGDDFIVDMSNSSLSINAMKPLPGLKLGLTQPSNEGFSTLFNAALIRDSGTTYFMSDDEIVILKGDGEHQIKLPNMPSTLQNHYLAKPDTRVIVDNDKVRAVAENRRYLVVADFISPSTAGYITANTPMLISTQHQLGNMMINVAVPNPDSTQSQVSFTLHKSETDFMDTKKLNRFMHHGMKTLLTKNVHVEDRASRVTLQSVEGKYVITVDMKKLTTPSYSFRLRTDY